MREVHEETGLEVEVVEYLGTWVDVYADDPEEPDAGVINVAYYRAAPTAGGRGALDPAEVSEVGWFAWDELAVDLAPPLTLEAALAAARAAITSPGRNRPR